MGLKINREFFLKNFWTLLFAHLWVWAEKGYREKVEEDRKKYVEELLGHGF